MVTNVYKNVVWITSICVHTCVVLFFIQFPSSVGPREPNQVCLSFWSRRMESWSNREPTSVDTTASTSIVTAACPSDLKRWMWTVKMREIQSGSERRLQRWGASAWVTLKYKLGWMYADTALSATMLPTSLMLFVTWQHSFLLLFLNLSWIKNWDWFRITSGFLCAAIGRVHRCKRRREGSDEVMESSCNEARVCCVLKTA